MNKENIDLIKNVPQKSIGVQKNDIHISNALNGNPLSIREKGIEFENPYDIVNHLETLLNRKIKGKNIRRVFEYTAKSNCSGNCSTSKEMIDKLDISYQTMKKILNRAVKNKMLVIHPEKKGHNYQYVLANMQDSGKFKRVEKEGFKRY